jgi:5-methylcytosine-specific restriction endonuclease McrA
MGMIHYIRMKSRERILQGDMPAWIHNSPRRRYIAAVVLSAPPWVDREALRLLHYRAVCLTELTGIPHELDHIVPLNHPLVCGLTVPWNLEIVTAKINGAKSNRWMPDQLELFNA